MKEQIEKKLGCSIEEHLMKLDELYKKYDGYEIECPPAFPDLTYEELDFVENYIKQKIA